MSTFNVSNARELDSALDDARSGDKILLAQGNYGELDINGRSFPTFAGNGAVTIASASDSRPAVFNEMDLRNVSNVTLEGLEFDDGGGSGKAFVVYNSDGVTIRDSSFEGVVRNGYAASWGLQILKAEDITVEGSEFRNFTKSASFIDIEDLVVRNNDFWGASIDSMVFGDVHDVRIEGNEVHDQKVNAKHTDMIQFWAVQKGQVSSDVTIKNNVLYSGGDGETHGIYIGNELVARGGGRSDFYKDFVIENNTVVSGQYHGLSVGATDGLSIRSNTVLQTPGGSDNGVTIPRIVVDDRAVDVKISGNTAHMISDDGGKSWSVGGNKIVARGEKASQTPSRDSGTSGDDSGGGAKAPQAPQAGLDGDGRAETFRFDGDNVKGLDRDKVAGLDFGEGDKLVLIDYDRNTFDDEWKDSNYVANSLDGRFVRIDSLADIHEIAAESRDIDVDVRGDTLVLTIDQNSGTHQISLEGLGGSYDALF